MKFLELCILPRIMPVSKCLFVVNINFVRHHIMLMNKKNMIGRLSINIRVNKF